MPLSTDNFLKQFYSLPEVGKGNILTQSITGNKLEVTIDKNGNLRLRKPGTDTEGFHFNLNQRRSRIRYHF